MNDDIVLKIQSVSAVFDGFHALTDVKSNVRRHEIHFFIGPNGAGKSTLMDIICGKTRASSGNVTFYPEHGEPMRLTGMKEYRIVQAGIGRKFQTPAVFNNLTVMDNMMLSLRGYKGVWQSILYKMSKEQEAEILDTLEMVGLKEMKAEKAGSLAHGQKQWLEIAMQLLQKPEIIMLDEPAAGMGKEETFRTGRILKKICGECTVIVIEHDMDFVRQIADVVTVLHEGRVLVEGSVEEVLADKTVQAVYLGRGGEKHADS